MGTPRPVNPAIWLSLGRPQRELPSFLINRVDNTFNMALSRTWVRLRNVVAKIVSSLTGERDVERLYDLSAAKTLRSLLTEKCGVAVADTSTVVAG